MSETEKIYRMAGEVGVEEAEGGMTLCGRAVVYDVPTVLYEKDGAKYYEVIARGALSGADTGDCCLKYNHSNGVPILARCRGGSLRLEDKEDGLYFRAALFNTSAAKDCYELVKQDALQCSFAFTVKDQEYDRQTRTRTIRKIDRLFDVSVVDVPAYRDTYVTARSFFESEEEKERLESLRRARTLARTKTDMILGGYAE